jgi:hypothetical protein
LAKLKLNRDLVKILLPVVIPIAKDLAAKTATKVDDTIVSAIESAVNNPVVFELLLSLLSGDEPVVPAEVSAETQGAVNVLLGNKETVEALFSLGKVDV